MIDEDSFDYLDQDDSEFLRGWRAAFVEMNRRKSMSPLGFTPKESYAHAVEIETEQRYVEKKNRMRVLEDRLMEAAREIARLTRKSTVSVSLTALLRSKAGDVERELAVANVEIARLTEMIDKERDNSE